VTRNIKSRIATIQNSNPSKVGIVHYVKPECDAYELESILQERYRDNRKHLEWFEFSEYLMEDCIKTMNQHKPLDTAG
jgi:hypothetical protein